MILNKKQIENLIPHRDPFLFLDTVDIITIGKKGIGKKKFNEDEFFF